MTQRGLIIGRALALVMLVLALTALGAAIRVLLS